MRRQRACTLPEAPKGEVKVRKTTGREDRRGEDEGCLRFITAGGETPRLSPACRTKAVQSVDNKKKRKARTKRVACEKENGR